MLLEEIYKCCSEYPGLNCKPNETGEILVYDNILSCGWDYFMTHSGIHIVCFYPMVKKFSNPTFYSTENLIDENTSFVHKGNELRGLTPNKLKEYLDLLAQSIKEAKQKIKIEELSQDF